MKNEERPPQARPTHVPGAGQDTIFLGGSQHPWQEYGLSGRDWRLKLSILPAPREDSRKSCDTSVSQKLLLPIDFKIIRVHSGQRHFILDIAL